METTESKKQEPLKDEHGAIRLPEHMDQPKVTYGRSPQSTAGTKTPGKKGRNHMSEAAERKARRDSAEQEEKS